MDIEKKEREDFSADDQISAQEIQQKWQQNPTKLLDSSALGVLMSEFLQITWSVSSSGLP